MITIGVSNGSPASRGPGKSANRSLMGGKEIIADSAGFLRHYLFIGMSKYVGGIYFYLLSHSLIIIFAPSRAITRRA
ncbi:hypothetical protein QEP77_11100 [Serratia sp. B1]|nr:hypothetical protein QEP77_11100 [Serratia sp. B1]